jgi:hypothetical protein
MIWFLRRKLLLLLYMLFIRLSTGSVHGLFFKRLLHRIWLQRLVNVWRRWPRSFLPGHMGGNLVSGLRVTSVFAFIVMFLFCFSSKVVCTQVVQRSGGSQDFVSSRCNNLEINKTSLIEKSARHYQTRVHIKTEIVVVRFKKSCEESLLASVDGCHVC